MERMQSTWENIVDYDLSESGVRPLTLRELMEMGFDLDAFLDVPLGYSQSNGTLELREALAALYKGSTVDHIEVTNGTSEANFLVALSQIRAGDRFALETPNYMQLWGVPRALGADTRTFRLRPEACWEPDWDEFDRAIEGGARMVYVSNPNNPTGSVLSDAAMKRIVEGVERAGALLLADEVYQGAEITGPRTKSFWGMSDRVVVTSGLSKAWGIPGVRIGWIVGPKKLIAECWAQHDYLTIGPNKLSDRLARVAVEPANREKCYARTRELLGKNIEIARQWVRGFGGFLEWREPRAGAIALMKYHASVPSLELCQRIRERQSTLIVPGKQLGIEGHVRIWLGGREDYLKEGLRRVAEELKPLVVNS
ncbi:MAG TPA: aminotransferase class I/II-fold pyridoxal phosphate-dependent enzyme [Bryobacteraceae bacterium]|nr:aminotransferase class I/II-fold pyridoxal phosphate-dependent enzyme [Bryobacteraceae bacterium]